MPMTIETTEDHLPYQKIALHPHADPRGDFTELYRADWFDGPPPVQWNYARSRGKVLRGVHVHLRHTDYLTVMEGSLLMATKDLRRASPTYGHSEVVELSGDTPCTIMIPPGVAHGFYSTDAILYTVGVSHYWDPINDEFGCRWDDADLAMPWPAIVAPQQSGRDQAAGSLAALLQDLRQRTGQTW